MRLHPDLLPSRCSGALPRGAARLAPRLSMLLLASMGMVHAAAADAGGAAASKVAIEAARYRTADGVEVLTNRPRTVAAPAAVPVPAEGRGAAAAGASDRNPVALTPVAAGARASPYDSSVDVRGAARAMAADSKVPVDVQQSRDDERLKILQMELVTEGRALDQAQRALRSPRLEQDLTPEQQQALRADLKRREENVRAIDGEIARVSPVRGARALAAGTAMR